MEHLNEEKTINTREECLKALNSSIKKSIFACSDEIIDLKKDLVFKNEELYSFFIEKGTEIIESIDIARQFLRGINFNMYVVDISGNELFVLWYISKNTHDRLASNPHVHLGENNPLDSMTINIFKINGKIVELGSNISTIPFENESIDTEYKLNKFIASHSKRTLDHHLDKYSKEYELLTPSSSTFCAGL